MNEVKVLDQMPMRSNRRLKAAPWLLLLLAAFRLLWGCTSRKDAAVASAAGSTPASPFHFVDVTARAGITFHHDNGATGRYYLPETMGSGCAFLDYDGDGLLDILLLNGRPLAPADRKPGPHPSCALYHNNGDGTFSDVTRESGLDLPMTAMGVAVGDYDNDGYPDLFITTVLGTDRLFHNTLGKRGAEGKREKEKGKGGSPYSPIRLAYLPSSRPPAPDSGGGSGIYRNVPPGLGARGRSPRIGDSGRVHLKVGDRQRRGGASQGGSEGGPIFEEVTARAGVGDHGWGSSAVWVDFDNDGYLDLFVCRYVRYRSLADEKLCSRGSGQKGYCPPDMYDGETCLLYHNNGDGTFTDVTRETGLSTAIGTSLGAALLDYDGDGWTDIAVTNDKRPNFLFHNTPAPPGARVRRVFKEVGLEAGLALDAQGTPRAGMGIDVADVNNDGKLSVAVSNFSNEGLALFQQQTPGLFVDVGERAGLQAPSLLMVGFGLIFADFDNEGRLDLLSVNGHVFPYAGGGDATAAKGRPTVAYQESKLLFYNTGGGVFREVGASGGDPFLQRHVGRGAAVGDFDNDGRLDILINNNNEAPELLHNEASTPGNWLQIEVHGGMRPGMRPHELRGPSNRDAVGARVTVKGNGAVQTQWVHSGSSYLSESMRRLHFGLGKATQAESVEVRFPGGAVVRRADVKANQHLQIDEP